MELNKKKAQDFSEGLKSNLGANTFNPVTKIAQALGISKDPMEEALKRRAQMNQMKDDYGSNTEY